MYDVIVIGSGPGGMNAALYAARSKLKTLVLDFGLAGGQMNNTEEVENYIGLGKISGRELSKKMYNDAIDFGVEFGYGYVSEIKKKGKDFVIITDLDEYITKSVVIATGSNPKKLGVDGEENFIGRGVSYCAVCDGAFFQDKDLVVVGGGDSAIEEALYLTQFSNVQIVHRRDKLRANVLLQERAFNNDKISFLWNTIVNEVKGSDSVNEIVATNLQTEKNFSLSKDGIFIYVGLEPNTGVFENLNITNEQGFILTNEKMETRIKGIYAVGDVREKELRQIATAVSDGAIAGMEVYKYIEENYN